MNDGEYTNFIPFSVMHSNIYIFIKRRVLLNSRNRRPNNLCYLFLKKKYQIYLVLSNLRHN